MPDDRSQRLQIEGTGPASLEPFGLWGRAFRPFFLGLGLHATLSIGWWVVAWAGAVAVPAWLLPMWWHGHEMVFGFAAAAIAGFLLTASAVWTGGPALAGAPLAALAAVWVLGRIAFAGAGYLPAWLVAVIDVAFLPAVAIAAIRTIRGSGQVRNYGVVGLVLVVGCANAAMHAEALGLARGAAQPALRFAVDLLIVLILVISGRITPPFTRNALRRQGLDHPIRSWPWLNAATVAAGGAAAAAGLLLGRVPATGWICIGAGLAAATRLAGWQSWHTRSDPLLWSLHAASAWIVVGFVLVGASDLGMAIPGSAGLHALTAGAIGSAIMAVVTRVGLGHTGRPLELPDGVVWCYVLVNAAALARVVAAFMPRAEQQPLLWLSGLAWAVAFAIFTLRYWPILVTPRPDGKPG